MEKKPRKLPVPANFERIMQGALKLDLEQKVNIRNSLTEAIDQELKEMEISLNKAKALLNGKS